MLSWHFLSSFQCPKIFLHLFIITLLSCFTFQQDKGVNQNTRHDWEYIIVGAGPAGLQMGYFLEKEKRDYVIFERSNISGSFYTLYPRHEKLISINKRYTGKTNKKFNMRHDWNSLLTDDVDFLFKLYSKEFFPHKDSILEYLSDFANKYQLNINYGKSIGMIRKDEESGWIVMEDQMGIVYRCKTLLLATGMWKPNIPLLDGIQHTVGYEFISTDPKEYEGKSILILGKGNAAFETAAAVYGSANVVHMVSGSRVRLSWQTHYVGDLRGVNNELLDTYQLKSLDGLLEGPLDQLTFRKNDENGKIIVYLKDNMTWDNYALREEYDLVIRCLGWVFDDSIFQNNTNVCHSVGRVVKYPAINSDFQLLNIKGVYVMGTAAHSLDYRRSSGGFIHGFRYSVEALHHLLEYRNHKVKWPLEIMSFSDLLPYVVKRVNEGSGIYQMFGELVDVIAINRNNETAEYFKEYPLQLIGKFHDITGYPLNECIIHILEYGKNFSGPGKDVFFKGRSVGQSSLAHKSNFLHPVFYYYKNITHSFMYNKFNDADNEAILPKPERVHHVVEDFLGVWDTPNAHVLPLRRFIEFVLNTDMRLTFNSQCFKLALLSKTLPYSCSRHYLSGHGLQFSAALLKSSV